MIEIIDKSRCCGCSACVQICPRHCLEMRADGEGFAYPVATNVDTCIDCGLCEKVCPVINQGQSRNPANVFAAVNKDDDIRKRSSSGGMFFLLAEQVIKSGGVVFGARFDGDWQVVIDKAESMEEVLPMMGSKYVQARADGCYDECKSILKSGRKVLFCGTPCQIAGLLRFLRVPYPNLLTCDFICHGTPSPKVWTRYLNEVVKAGLHAIEDVEFRNKGDGWKRFRFSLSYNEAVGRCTLSSCHDTNPYMRAFLSDMILRPSCHACPAKDGKSGSDITIADFWGIDNVAPEMDDDGGVSMVVAHTEKGLQVIPFDKLEWRDVPNESLRFNSSYKTSVRPHRNREKFFASLDNTTDLQRLISDCLRPTMKEQLRLVARYPFRQAKRLAKLLINGGGGNSTLQI